MGVMIQKLKSLFARYGILQQGMSNNGPQINFPNLQKQTSLSLPQATPNIHIVMWRCSVHTIKNLLKKTGDP